MNENDIGLEEKEQKKIEYVIIRTKEWYRDLKFTIKTIFILVFIGLLIYGFYKVFDIYLIIDFFISLPIALYIANKIIRKNFYHILLFNLKNNKLTYIRLPTKYKLEGKYTILNSNKQIIVAEKIEISKIRQKAILKSNSIYLEDKIKFLIDSKIVDNVVDTNEKLTIKYYRLRKLFINKLLRLFRVIQEQNLVEAIKMLKTELENSDSDMEVSKEVIEID